MATIENLRVGDRIADKYVVERVLGQGGMGIVVAARHVELDQSFAIKFVLPDALRQPGIADRLLEGVELNVRGVSRGVLRLRGLAGPESVPWIIEQHRTEALLREGRLTEQVPENSFIQNYSPANGSTDFAGDGGQKT